MSAMGDIIEAVSAETKVRVLLLVGNDRSWKVSAARQLAMVRLYAAGYGMDQIAAAFGRSRPAVSYAMKKARVTKQ